MSIYDKAEMARNPMLTPKIEKAVVNISVGKSGELLEKAKTVLDEITGRKSCVRRAKKTVRDFGIRKGEPISCIATLRGEEAVAFLKRALDAVGNKVSKKSFDDQGNMSFGIKEHIEIPGIRYRPEVGIFGMDISVAPSRLGYRVARRRRLRSRIGKSHRVTKDDSMKLMKQTLNLEILE